MTPEQYRRVGELYHDAMELAPGARSDFLARACGGEEELRREVESLLRAHEQADGFIAGKADAVAELAARQQNLSLSSSLAPSLIGHSVSHYQVLSLLGAGGMGEVYLAQDTRLGRKVALKLLPRAFTRNEERLHRFEQEARTVSALNHPNILTIYEVGAALTEDGETQFIATEFIDGQTLRERLRNGRLDLSESLDVATQIAVALSAAHEAGIVHRDIKPENVMLRRDGIVKILDFGLAKLTEPQIPAEMGKEAAARQKVTTEAGSVLGTPQYMSPEQARGQKADARSDIFSVGVVCYEMLTDRPPFDGVNAIEVMGAILKTEPDPLTHYAPDAPAQLQRIVSKALHKDRDQRYQSSNDLLLDLKRLKEELTLASKSQSAAASGSDAIEQTASAVQIVESHDAAMAPVQFKSSSEAILTEIKRHKRGVMLALAVLMVAIAGAGWALYRYITRLQSQVPSAAPVAQTITSLPGSESYPSFSPDGNQITFTWGGENEGNGDIYVKQIGTEAMLRLTNNPAEDLFPSWSPDGRDIAFIRQTAGVDQLYLTTSIGGSERRITDFSPFLYWGGEGAPSWSPDGKWLAIADRNSPQEPYAIFLVVRETGEKRRVTSPPPGIIGDSKPAISPDGKTLAFIRYGKGMVSDIYLTPMAGGEAQRLTFENAIILFPAWTSDSRNLLFLSYVGNTSLWKISAAGGKPERVVIPGQNVISFAVSRLGNQLAWSQGTNDSNIWQVELAGAPRFVSRKQTSKMLIASTKAEFSPQFSPDGKRIVFASYRTGTSEIWVCSSDGQNPVQLTSLGKGVTGAPRWSPDGRQIVFDGRLEGSADIYVINAEGGKPRRLTTESSEDIVPSWSRDGQWIYFCSNRSGNHQIWKMPAAGGQAIQVTQQGGFECLESPDGKFLYYLKGRNLPGIWRLPTAGGEETFMLDQHRAGLWRQWAVVEHGIYFATAEMPDHPLIEFFSFATGKVTPALTLEKRLPGTASGLSVSPDGRRLIWTQVDQASSDILLLENFR